MDPERVTVFWTRLDQYMAEHPAADRFKRWRLMSLRPGRVMMWTPEQTGRFLDFIQGDPPADMLEIIAATGIRRGEACGLP
jgi:integrase